MAASDNNGKTVLIVDDEPVNRLVLGRMVEYFGAHAVEVESAAQALEVLAAQVVDVVLMDIHMPLMTGIQAVERLRATPGPNAEVPVVAVTGDTTRTCREYIALGFDGYANKPVSLADVERMLQASRTASAQPARLAVR